MSRPARALINTAALKHNLDIVRQFAPDSNVMAVVKANAYGHGLVTAAKALSNANEYGVASIDEALALREVGISCPITALTGFFNAEEIPLFVLHQITAVIHSRWQVQALESVSQSGRIKVWLKVDTGMNRLGIKPANFDSVLERLRRCELVSEIGLLSHLARADEIESDVTGEQIQNFKQLTERCEAPRSLANSAGIAAWPESHGDIVRPGIMLYGSSPLTTKTAAELGLRPVMTVQSKLITINQQQKGDAIGYGGDWRCPEDMAVGVVAFGYGDGYPRHAPGGTPVIVNGARVPLVGRVSMDMIMVDLRNVKATVGDEVELWGSNLSVDEVARCADTISYELLCHVTERVPRSSIET
ncbi:MAG: alanine racemase [Acidiferrobacterales bacterium]